MAALKSMDAPSVLPADRAATVKDDEFMHGDLDAIAVFGERPSGCWPRIWYQFRLAGCGTAFVDKRAHNDDDELQLEDKPPAKFHHVFSLGRRCWIMILFTLLAAFVMADQNVLAPNLTAAADFFGFDDNEKDIFLGGYVSAAFFAVGAPAGIVVGWLADRVNRRNLLVTVAILGNIPLMFMMLVTEYWHFLLIRLLTGISVGGVFPLIYSMMGDLFPINERAFVASFIANTTGGGIFIGQLLSGFIGPMTDWRLPFVIVGAPAIVIAIFVFFTTEEAPRGAAEDALRATEKGGKSKEYNTRITWHKVRLAMRIPSNWLLVLQGLPASLPWGMFFVFFNDYLQQEMGFSTGVSSTIIIVFGVGAALGVTLGGIGGQWLFNRRKEWQAWLSGVTTIVGLGPGLYLINADLKQSLAGTMVAASVGGFLQSISAPNLKSIVVNVNDPELRGVAFALVSMTDDLGKALGPLLVAGVVTGLGRMNAFNMAVSLWGLAGLLMIGLAFCMRNDEAAVQARLRAEAAEHEAKQDDEWEQSDEGVDHGDGDDDMHKAAPVDDGPKFSILKSNKVAPQGGDTGSMLKTNNLKSNKIVPLP